MITLTSCQFKDPSRTHGINALKNKEKILVINKTNKNDVIKLIGRPHSVSVISDDIWIYVERVLSKGELLNLGRNILIVNNSLVLKFDKYGIFLILRGLSRTFVFSLKVFEHAITLLCVDNMELLILRGLSGTFVFYEMSLYKFNITDASYIYLSNTFTFHRTND